MGRPRKNAGAPDARQRIIDAFWKLLESHRLKEITVGMIVREASCNRGTFYYHFNDMDALVFNAVEDELLGDSGVSKVVFDVVSGMDEKALAEALSGRRMERFSLLIRQGGRDVVERSIKTVIIDMWSAVLCPDGEELNQTTTLLIEYASSGIIGVISHVDDIKARGESVEVNIANISRISKLTLELVAESQGLTMDDISMRLKILNQFSRASQR